jgi:hypothetical protein
VIVQGSVPVRATDSVAELPLQIAVVPLITAVGLVFIVTAALPENVPVQFASFTAVNVYVVAVAGETVNVYGDVVIPVTVTGVTPLV